MMLSGGRVHAQSSVAESNDTAASTGAQVLGRNACAAATCHGGPIVDTIDWNSSLAVFEARDAHAEAGLLLENDLSRRIVERLNPATHEDPQLAQQVLLERCSGCHAPAAVSWVAADQTTHRNAYREGVSCEACHGPAASWLDSHLQSDNPQDSGMWETTGFIERVEGCVGCHVGSREGNPKRDVNHDMVAAGHPPLRFDPWAYLRRLPSHWDDSGPPADGLPVDEQNPQLRRFLLGRLIALDGSLALTAARAGDASRGAPHSVWPDLADFDCFACHQRLRIAHFNKPVSSGYPRYNPWLAAGSPQLIASLESEAGAAAWQSLLDRLRLRGLKSSQVSGTSRELRNAIQQPIEMLTEQVPLPSEAVTWHPFPDPSSETNQLAGDWYLLAYWFLQTQARLADRQQGSLATWREDLSEVHALLHFRPLSGQTGIIADSPAQFDLSEFADPSQRLNDAAKPPTSP